MIEGWKEAMLCSGLSSGELHRKFHFTWKKKSVVMAQYLQWIKTFLILELS